MKLILQNDGQNKLGELRSKILGKTKKINATLNRRDLSQSKMLELVNKIFYAVDDAEDKYEAVMKEFERGE